MSRMAATRDGYGQALLELAGNESVVVLEADLGKSTKSLRMSQSSHLELSHSLRLPLPLLRLRLGSPLGGRCPNGSQI